MMNKAVFIHVAMFSALADAIPARNIDSLTPAPVTANVFKRIIANDENWCQRNVHESEGIVKPTTSICNWNLDRSFSVYCAKPHGGRESWVQSFCPIGTLCEQREYVRLWNGLDGLDVECRPSANLVKWAIGSRQTGESYTKYCSNRISYKSNGGRSAIYEFYARFVGTTGLQTQVNQAYIYLNDLLIQRNVNSNQVGTTHQLGPGDIIRYCAIPGSLALLEGYATAKIKSYINADGTEEEATETNANDFKMVFHEGE
ncbi:hypothetical protein PTMSG1_04979 [Pyrenophora teres f. maculata]|nr:hypothetical protein PTMSG1_04979 [Pyrenophora teres f. maculata]